MPLELLLLRHGETAWSKSGQHTGTTDLPLLDSGRAQACALAPALGALRPAAVWASPLQRAQETARLAGLTITATVPDLREWNYGQDEGKTSAQIAAERPSWSFWDDGCPGGETPAAVGARADRVLSQAQAELPGGGLLVLVSHGHFSRVLVARWLGLPAGHGRYWIVSPASLTRLGHEHERPVLQNLNRLSL